MNDLEDIYKKLKTPLPLCRICLEVSMEYIDCEDTLCVLDNGRELTFYQGYNEIVGDSKDNLQIHPDMPKNFCINCGNELINAYLFIKRIEHANGILNKLKSFTNDSVSNEPNKNDHNEQEGNEIHEEFPDPEAEDNLEEDCENYEELFTLDGTVKDEQLEMESTVTNDGIESHFEAGKVLLVCQYCELLCGSEENLVAHKKTFHTNDNEHPLIENDEGIPNTFQASEQQEKGHYTCDICSCSFETKKNFNIHKIRAHDPCKKSQQNSTHSEQDENQLTEIQIETHLQTNSTEKANSHSKSQNRYTCHICGKVCLRKFTLRKHIQYIHMSERKKYQCEECGLFFPFPSNLNEHRRKHNQTNQFKCPHCERTFLRKPQLEIHMRYHLNIFPYKCDKCDKCYATKSNLTDHIRAKHTTITYDCDKCKQTFKSQTGLRKHKYAHDGYPYNCPLCSIGQTSRSGMKQHLMGVHKDALTEEEFDVMFPIVNPRTGYRRPKELSVK